MFSVYLRAGVTLLAGAPLVWAWQTAMDMALEQHTKFVTNGSPLLGYVETAVYWFPLVALLMILIHVVAGGIAQRRTVGRGF